MKIKTIPYVLLLLALLCIFQTVFADTDILVVYFSHTGETYNVGMVTEGNTAKMGKIIAEQTGAYIFELIPVVPYSQVHAEVLNQSTEEQRTNARPEYQGEIENWDQYNTIFIGYPIWWGAIPNIVYTFMESYDFSGKTVIPFNTHEGSGQSHTQQDIERLLSNATVLKGLAVQGKTAQEDPQRTSEIVSTWLEGLNMKKTNTNTEEEQVMAAYEAIQQAMIDKDIEVLDQMFVDGTIFTHMSGKTQTKAEFFGEIADGTLNYYAYHIHDPQITVNGTEAELIASVTLTAKVYGASGSWTLPVHARFTKTDGKWISHN